MKKLDKEKRRAKYSVILKNRENQLFFQFLNNNFYTVC